MARTTTTTDRDPPFSDWTPVIQCRESSPVIQCAVQHTDSLDHISVLTSSSVTTVVSRPASATGWENMSEMTIAASKPASATVWENMSRWWNNTPTVNSSSVTTAVSRPASAPVRESMSRASTTPGFPARPASARSYRPVRLKGKHVRRFGVWVLGKVFL